MRGCVNQKNTVVWHWAAMLKRLRCMGMLASEYWNSSRKKQQSEETQTCYKVLSAWNSKSTFFATHLVS